LFGFFIWCKGLAIGGIARVSQTQLLQPFLSIAAAIVLLNEKVELRTYSFAPAVVVAIVITRKMQIKKKSI
jgi:drug/metabolite transporter (DMT)-like permease